METSDRTLLERFIVQHDEVAFRALVGRHLDLVHAVAKRVTASEDHARDVAQATFVRLAQRAALVPRDVSLTAWLHRTCRSLAIDLVRAEMRRKQRESIAISHGAMNDSSDIDWRRLAPVIDELVDALSAADRELVLAKYYRNESHASIASRLGLTEVNARQRAARALEKLRVLLGRRGIATSAAALATVLPAHAIIPAPASLALAVSSAASGVIPAAPQALSIHLAMTASQKSAVVAASVVFLASLGYAIRPETPAAAAILTSGTATASRETNVSSRSRIIRPLPASAEGRLERLREILSLTSSTQRTREMLDFIDQLPASAFGETADFLHSWDGTSAWTECALLVASWAKVDPLKAADWAKAYPEKTYQDTVLSCWGEYDPDRAMDWIKRNYPGRIGIDAQVRAPWLSVILGLASRDLGAAVKAFDAIASEQARADIMYHFASRLSHSRPGALDDLLEKVKGGSARSRVVELRLPSLIESDPRHAWEMLQADEEAGTKFNVKYHFQMWRDRDAAASEAAISLVPEGELREEAVRGFCFGAVNADPEKTFALLWQHPGAADDETIAKMAQDCAIEHVGFGLEQALKIKDEILRNEVLAGRLTWWTSINKEDADRWMDTHQIPATLRERAKAGAYDPFAR
jgi:RNA polymerase sigma factor (sigma-70 family)